MGSHHHNPRLTPFPSQDPALNAWGQLGRHRQADRKGEWAVGGCIVTYLHFRET